MRRGANRVSASRLWDISQIIDVPINYFFEDMSDVTVKSSPRKMTSGTAQDIETDDVKDPMARRETLELVRTYYSIEQPHVRRRIADMVKSIATTIKGINTVMSETPNNQTDDLTFEEALRQLERYCICA